MDGPEEQEMKCCKRGWFICQVVSGIPTEPVAFHLQRKSEPRTFLFWICTFLHLKTICMAECVFVMFLITDDGLPFVMIAEVPPQTLCSYIRYLILSNARFYYFLFIMLPVPLKSCRNGVKLINYTFLIYMFTGFWAKLLDWSCWALMVEILLKSQQMKAELMWLHYGRLEQCVCFHVCSSRPFCINCLKEVN